MEKNSWLFNEDKITCIQWHLTSRCEGKCRFCYMLDSPNYRNELENELSPTQCIEIIYDYLAYLKKFRFFGRVILTGGDPLLREDFWDILSALNKLGIPVSILGNPHLIWDETAKRLAGSGIKHYQLSIDGTEKTHDYFRGKGSFKKTWKAVDMLKKYRISVGISYTLSAKNYLEIEKVIELCKDHGVNFFRPSRLVPEGRGREFENSLLTPQQLRDTYDSIINNLFDIFKKSAINISFSSCDGLRFLSITDVSKNTLPDFMKFRISASKGCNSKLITILPEGTMYVCRRLPIKIGEIQEMSIEEAFNSPLAVKLRDPASFEKCRKCDKVNLCRGGCRAVTNAVTGDPFDKDPQCWVTNTAEKREEVFNGKEFTQLSKSPLLKPLRIGTLVTSNRIFRSATMEGAAKSNGTPSEKLFKIYEDLAKGECGLIITGVSYVSRDAKVNNNENGIYEDKLIPEWKNITDRIHAIRGKIAMQITHQGYRNIPLEGELFSPSPHNCYDSFGNFNHSRMIREDEIWEVIKKFAEAIKRVEAAGFDAVQLQLAHFYLLGQFLSPRVNRRDDHWGGKLENRLRIIIYILRYANKLLINKNFPILVKINCFDGPLGGLNHIEAADAIRILSKNGVTAFELSKPKIIETGETKKNLEECDFQEEGKIIRDANPDVVMGIGGGIKSWSKMEELLNIGFDFVSLSRPFIREPDLIKKMMNNYQRKSQCVSCSLCNLRVRDGGGLKCTLKS